MASSPDRNPRVLVLDYSVDRSEGPLFARWVPEGYEYSVSSVFFGDPIPSTTGFTHVMHTGSSLSICVDAEFVPRAAELVRECIEEGIPQIGVCYGHQLICRAILGPGAVGRCPQGIEAGWIDIRMMGSGLSIPGAAPVVKVMQSHFDRVISLPEGAEIIAGNSHTDIQAFADRKRRLLSYQFHPEFDREIGNRLFLKERDMLSSNGIDVDTVIEDGPSIDTGHVFFGYFFGEGWFDR